MKSRLLLVTLLCVAGSSPAAARPSDVVWDVKGCDETAAILPGRGLQEGNVLVALAYRCEEATVGSARVEDLAVSEISVLHADFSSTLLRQVTNSPELRERLRALGLKDSFLGDIAYPPGAPLAGPTIEVTFGRNSYSFSGTGGSWPIPPQPTTGGASYTYEGRKGTISLSYSNHSQSATPARVVVDATRDPRLREWMGSETASGGAVVVRGDWTGTASLIE